VRCVRNLGTDPRIEPTKDNEIDNAFSHDATNRMLYMDRYTDISLRDYVDGYIKPHDVGSEESRPYKAFQYAKSYCKNISDEYISVGGDGVISFKNASNEGTKSYRWYQSLMQNGICGKYSEAEDQSDLDTWRVPTFREMSIMYNVGILNGADQLSCSRNHFVVWPEEKGYTVDGWAYEFLGYNDDWNRKVLAKDVMLNRSGSLKVRCVKDILQ
jgi:hypothetical protein